MKKRILITSGKGGVGKTTLCAMLADWLLDKGHSIKLVDSDSNKSLDTYIDKCEELGREVSDRHGNVEIIDTAGNIGGAGRFLSSADYCFVPFKPNAADLEVVVGWYLQQRDDVRKKSYFIPNETSNTKAQAEGMQALKEVLGKDWEKKVLPSLATRKAVYPGILQGSEKNLFQRRMDSRAKTEITTLMQAIEKVITK